MTKDEQTKLNTELIEASKNGKLEEVKELIEKGAKVEGRNTWHWTPLHLASNYGYLEVVKYLIEKGAEVVARDKHDETPLLLAAFMGHVEVVKYLIEKGAEVEEKNKWNQTPLHWAVKRGYFEMLQYLFLERNALMTIPGMFDYSKLMKEKVGKETEAQSIFDYFLQNKSKYKPEDIKHFKMRFLQFHMSEDDSRNLKPIVNFF